MRGTSSSPRLMSEPPISVRPNATISHLLIFGARVAPDQDGRRIVLVSTMRNEGPHILEWVAYHLAVGFTDIVICTNDCIDESPLLLDRLQQLGLVTHLAN